MPKKNTPVPDAWDDNWEAQADAEDAAPAPKPEEEEIKITKAERLKQHAETNRKIWESAEEPPAPPIFLLAQASQNPIPLQSSYKPTLKLLSRKPPPKQVQKIDPVTGLLTKLSLDDEEEDEGEQKVVLSPEELRVKAQREREEKQRKYDEARARILGTGSGGGGGGGSRGNSPGTGSVTPPVGEGGGRGKRGGRGGGRGQLIENSRPGSQSGNGSGNKELYDPNYTPKPGGVTIQKRSGGDRDSARSSPKPEEQVIRSPRGPDANSKGFGFSPRGGKTTG